MQNVAFGFVHDSIARSGQIQNWHAPPGHSLLLRQSWAEATFAVGHTGPGWHEATAVVLSMVWSERQQISPSAQSPFSSHSTCAVEQAAVVG